MAVTGQFGKAVTGAGSLASAISGIASEYTNLRINRIYNAFVNEDVFEGRRVTFNVALELLNKMLKRSTKGGKVYAEIEDTIRNLRTSNRNRTLNAINTKLAAEGGSGDYANRVRVLKEMLLDQTIDPDERDQLTALLTTAVNEFLKNTQQQFLEGKKVTINGTSFDFAGKANEDVFLGVYDDMMTQFPEMANQIGSAQDLAKAAVLIRAADFDYSSSDVTTDSKNLAATKAKLAGYQKAYEIIKNSKYGLATGSDALSLLEEIQTLTKNVTTLGTNVKAEADQERYGDGRNEIYGSIDAIEAAMRSQSPQVDNMLGNDTLQRILTSNANDALLIIDAFIAANGYGTKITGADGKTYDLSRDSIYEIIVDAKDAAAAFNTWAKNNPSLSKAQKTEAATTYKDALSMVGNIPSLRAEDKYDNAREKLVNDLEVAGGNMKLRANALKNYAAALTNIASSVQDLNSPAVNALREEAKFFLTGKPPKDNVTFATLSGNYSLEGFFGANDISIAISSSTETDLGSALTAFWRGKVDREKGSGDPVVSSDGSETDTLTPGWEDAAGAAQMYLGRTTPTEYGEATVDLFTGTIFERIRIVSGDYNVNDLDDKTVGWVTVYYDANGKKQYIVTGQNMSGNRMLTRESANALIKIIGSPTSFGGNPMYIARSATVLEYLKDGKYAGDGNARLSEDDMTSGTAKLYEQLNKNGYGFIVTGGEKAEYASLLKAVQDGHIRYVNGRFLVDDYDDGSGVIGTFDMTGLINDNVLALAVTNAKDFVPIIKRGGDTGLVGSEYDPDPWNLGGEPEGGNGSGGGNGAPPPPQGSVPMSFSGGDNTVAGQQAAWDKFNQFRSGERELPKTTPTPTPPKPEEQKPVVRQEGNFNNGIRGTGGLRIPQSDLIESKKIFNTVMRNMPTNAGGVGGKTTTTTPRKVVAYNPITRGTNKVAK